MRQRQGFTIIEIILVVGLVMTLGAMAAPQFTDVLDDSKEKADIAQMDQILAAFQMQQGMIFENHLGDYDMLNQDNVEEADQSDPKAVAKASLQNFLEDALTNAGSAVFMEGVESAIDGKRPTKDDLIYEVAASSTHVWLIHKIPFSTDLESSVKVRIPGVSVLDDPYLQGDLENGTWFVVGDDDRLRADYVEDYMKKNDKKEEQLNEKAKDNEPYRFRTKFKIVTDLKEKEVKVPLSGNLDPDDRWITWQPGGVNSVRKILVKPNRNLDELNGVTVEAKFNDGDFVKVPDAGKQIDLDNNSSGKQDLEYILYRFTKPGEETKYMYYQVSLVQENKLDTFILSNESVDGSIKNNITLSDQDRIPGMIRAKDKGGNPHILYYAFTRKDLPDLDDDDESAELTKKIVAPIMDFYTGVILNINQSNSEKKKAVYNQYDFLAFHYNESTASTDLVYYKVHGNGSPTEQSRINLDGFQYNHEYTLELDVKKEKVIFVSLFDGSVTLLDNNEMQTDNNALRPAVGFYMNQQATLKNDHARAAEEDHLPLIAYESGGGEGPQWVLLGMPDFYPYESGASQPTDPNGGGSTGDDSNTQPEEPTVSFSAPEISPYTGNPDHPYEVSAKTKGNAVEFTWLSGIENESFDAVDWTSKVECLDAGQSGWLFAREVKDGQTAPKEEWVKKPWVELDELVWKSKGTQAERTVTVEGITIPTAFEWEFSEGMPVGRNGVKIDLALGIEKIVQANVRWNNGIDVEQVSRFVSSPTYTYQLQEEPELTIRILKSWRRTTVEVQATKACKVKYLLVNNGGNVSQKDTITIRDDQVMQNIVLINNVNQPKLKIILKSLENEVIGNSGRLLIWPGVYVLDEDGWRSK